MNKISTIQIIDSLAEMTRHHDREIIEKSLLKTLDELTTGQEFRLYRVIEAKPKIVLGMLAYSVNSVIDTAGKYAKTHCIPEHLNAGIEATVSLSSLEQVLDKDGRVTHYIYPAIDHNNDVFAVLIQECKKTPDLDILRYAHGLLKVYANYLELIDNNERDKLTQLLNRETLDKELISILIRNNEKNCRRRIKREKNPLGFWLGVVDIDHFKAVNDRFGHLFGDEVLILVARQMKSDIRGDEDLIYRFGGEEFVILLQAYEMKEAKSVFERLRKNIENQEFPQLGHVTVSIGIMQVTNQDSPSEAIACADQALYYAKEHGRNQIRVYEELLEQGLIEKAPQSPESGDVEFF
ncbi:GGDEF domain-containing protein [Methylotuvimicrobium sp. KM1]|uniref:GGDEF domain-containing protein n=1 Tax=Methylotuvimicrobium sp. KM1 TaxID=3377707 RepID=UPI00384EC77C